MLPLLRRYLLFQRDNSVAHTTLEDNLPIGKESKDEYYPAKEFLSGESIMQQHGERKMFGRNNVIKSNAKEGKIPKLPSDTTVRRRTINRLLKELKNESIHVATLVDQDGRIFFSIEMTDIIRNDVELNNIANMVQEIMQESLERLVKEVVQKKKKKRLKEKEVDEVTKRLKRHLFFESRKKVTDEATQSSRPCCSRSKLIRQLFFESKKKVTDEATQISRPCCSRSKLNGTHARVLEQSDSSEETLVNVDRRTRHSPEECLNMTRIGSSILCSSNEKELRSLLYSYILSHLDNEDVTREEEPKERDESSRAHTRPKNDSRIRTSNNLHVQIPLLDKCEDFVKCEVYLKRKKELLKKKMDKKNDLRRRSDSLFSDLSRPKRPNEAPIIIKFKKEKGQSAAAKTSRDVKKSLLRLKKQIERKLKRSKKYEEKKKRKKEEKLWKKADRGSDDDFQRLIIGTKGEPIDKVKQHQNNVRVDPNHPINRKQFRLNSTESFEGRPLGYQETNEEKYQGRMYNHPRTQNEGAQKQYQNKNIKKKPSEATTQRDKRSLEPKESFKVRLRQVRDKEKETHDRTKDHSRPERKPNVEETIRRDSPSSSFVRITEYNSTSGSEYKGKHKDKSKDEEKRTDTKKPTTKHAKRNSFPTRGSETTQIGHKKLTKNVENNFYTPENQSDRDSPGGADKWREHSEEGRAGFSMESPEKLIAVTFFGSGLATN